MNKPLVHAKITQELNEIYKSKNADYGDAFGDTFQKLGIVSAVTRISDKTNRLVSLAAKTDEERLVKDETIKDTLMDLANYAIMTLIEMEKDNQHHIVNTIGKNFTKISTEPMSLFHKSCIQTAVEHEEDKCKVDAYSSFMHDLAKITSSDECPPSNNKISTYYHGTKPND